MRLIVLKICGGIAVLTFLTMLTAIARHRVHGSSQKNRPSALAEYLWATLPWLMIISSAIPAVRQIAASACEPSDAAPVAGVLGRASHALLSKMTVVIDEQEREQR